MTFSEIIKSDADKKHSDLLSGKTECSITSVKISSYSEYKEKSHVYHQRLNREAEELNSALETIKTNKSSADKAKRQADRDAKKAADERKRKEHEQANAEAARKKKARNITIFAIIVAIIIGSVVVSKISKAIKYSEDNVVISILSKGEGFDDSSYYDGYVTGLEIEVKNKGSLDIKELKGLMEIYNADDDKLISTNVTLTGDIKSKKTVEFKLDIDERESEEIIELYNSELEELKITFQLTYLIYEGYDSKEFDDAKVRTLTKASKKSDSDKKNTVKKEVREQFDKALNAYGDVDINSATFEADITSAVSLLDNIWDDVTKSDVLLKELYDEAAKYESYEGYEKAYFLYALLANLEYKDSSSKMQECYNKASAVSYDSSKPGSLGVTVTELFPKTWTFGNDSEGYVFVDLENGGLCIESIDNGFDAATKLQYEDVIIEIDGQSACTESELKSALSGKMAGDTVTVTFYRRDQIKHASVKLGYKD